jgi:hypothetical protein
MTPETSIQITFVQLVRQFGGNRFLWFSIPNEGRRGKAQTGILKAMGMRPGVADMCFMWVPVYDPSLHRVVFLEFKSPKGKQSPPQQKFEALCRETGVDYAVVVDPYDAWRYLQVRGCPFDHILDDRNHMKKR